MKTITIGRGDDCNIVINDYRISRKHALLKIHTFGKMEIVDLGKNGTCVNAVKLRPGVPFPVKRNDVVILANAAQLNWKSVPNPLKSISLWAGIIGFAVVLCFTILLSLKGCSSSDDYLVGSGIDGDEVISGRSIPSDSLGKSQKQGKGEVDSSGGEKKDKLEGKTLKELFSNGAKSKKDKGNAKEDQKTNKDKKDSKPTKGQSSEIDEEKTYELL